MEPYAFELFGELPRINRKLAPAYNKKTRKSFLRINKKWKEQYEGMVLQLVEQRQEAPIEQYVDMLIFLSVDSSEDSDAPIKGIMDAMEKAEIIADDNLVRNLFIIREDYDNYQEDHARIELYHEDLLSNSLLDGMAERLR